MMASDRQQGVSQRSRTLEKMAGSALDVLVIGGGIVGAGVARDAAMRGLAVGLVDRRDFASGTSSRSSRLLHGGLRYLAQGRLGLVREASLEKLTLHRIAPHLAQPLAFIFPGRAGTEWKLWELRIGVKVYDWLCSRRNFGASSAMDRDELLRVLPGIAQEGLKGAVRYFDGMTNDARLVVDTLRSAAGHGATLCSYAAFEAAERREGIWKCRIRDELDATDLEVSTRSIVNAAGAWAGAFAPSRVKLRLTKGVHLVIDRERLNVPEAVVMTEGSRILFAIPWGERLILGTTDTDYHGPVDEPVCEREDAQYVLGVVNGAFPRAKISAADVISTWAGLRPLVASGRETEGDPSDISRRHEIHMTEPGWFDVTGGKLTTYRLMAEQTVDRVASYLGRELEPCRTAQEALLPEAQTKFSGILPPVVCRQAVEQHCRDEWAIHLDDVMVRRSGWRYYHREHMEIARKVAGWMKEILGWDEGMLGREITRYGEICGVALNQEAR